MPEVARAYIERARQVGGDEGERRIKSSLYVGCGPHGKSYTGGVINKDDDYVEAEAAKAATAHANDSVLGPFYRWIVEIEQRDRENTRLRHESDMAGDGLKIGL